MKITIRDIATDAPIPGIAISVDGTPVGTTDTNGEITSAPSGVMIESPDNFKITFRDALDDREIWMDQTIMPPPPPPPGPLMTGS